MLDNFLEVDTNRVTLNSPYQASSPKGVNSVNQNFNKYIRTTFNQSTKTGAPPSTNVATRNQRAVPTKRLVSAMNHGVYQRPPQYPN